MVLCNRRASHISLEVIIVIINLLLVLIVLVVPVVIKELRILVFLVIGECLSLLRTLIGNLLEFSVLIRLRLDRIFHAFLDQLG